MAKAPVKKVDLDRRLAQAFKKWEGAKEEMKGGGFDEYDDGRYYARLEKTEVGVSANDRLQVAMHWKFLSGDYKGKTKVGYQGIETEDNLKFFGRDLNKLGYETDDVEGPDDLKGIIKELNKEKPKAKISLKTNGEFQNVRILAVGDDDEDTDDEDGDSDEEESDTKKKKSKSKKNDDDDDDDEDSLDDVEEPKKKSKSKSKSKDEDEDEDEDEESSDDDEEEDTKKKSKKKSKDDDDDDEEESSDDDDESNDDDDEDEANEVSVGSDIVYKFKGKKHKGTVLEIFPKDNKLRVQTDDVKRRISFDDVVDVEVPAKSKKKTKK